MVFKKTLHPCALDESSLSIGRLQLYNNDCICIISLLKIKFRVRDVYRFFFLLSQSRESSLESGMDKMKKILSSPMSRKKVTNGAPCRVFGVPLDELLPKGTDTGPPVPNIVSKICTFIKNHCEYSIRLYKEKRDGIEIASIFSGTILV